MTPERTPYSLEDILPHRGDMLLLSEVLEADCDYAVTTAVIRSSMPLADTDGVRPLLMVELAAQTAGVCNGLDRIRAHGIESDKKGWLVGIKRATFHVDCLPLGKTVVTRSENSHVYDKLREVSSLLHMDGVLIGEVTLQLYQL
jgi:predicted hotdog family 3-hydroxylacyl-ACP dehydratase